MRKCRFGSLVALVWLALGASARAGEVARFWSDEPCAATVFLVVPGEAVRAHPGLALLLLADPPASELVVRFGPAQATLVLRRDGQETTLSETRIPLPAEAQRVTVGRSAGGLTVGFDGITVLRSPVDLPEESRWGIEGAPGELLDQILLQPTADIYFADDFMRTPDAPSPWEIQGGDWQVAQLEEARYSVNAFNFQSRAADRGPALATAGHWFWGDLTVEVSVKRPPEAGSFGVGLGAQPDGRVYLLRVVSGTGKTAQAQLVRVGGGDETILARASVVVSPDDWHRLALTGVGSRLSGALDGVELVAAPADRLGQGQIALWMAGPQPVAFDDVLAYSGPREAQPPVVLSHETAANDPGAEAFVDDQYMKEWSDESDQWLSGGEGLWQAGYFWGDVELTWEVPEKALTSPVQLHLGVPPESDTFRPCSSAVNGCHLALVPEPGGRLQLTLRENESTRTQSSLALPELPTAISLRRVGDRIEAVVAEQVVAEFTTTLPAEGKVGLTGRAARQQADRLSVTSRQVVDSTFRAAPTEWTIGAGQWGVSSRWACTPRWAWFQGRSEDLASIWTRRRFTGDQVVEFFAGIPMDQPWAPFYRHPGNLAVTLCGSDGTPGSGYSLIFAGWGNSASGIFRRGELVARVPGVVMPDIVDSLGGQSDAHKLHNEWWRIRAEKMGSTVRLLVDGQVAASFTDPEPLLSGEVGIWTLNQAITVARARIFYQSAERILPPVPQGPAAEAAPDGWRAASPGSCEVSLANRDERSCLEVINPTAGGSFALATPFTGVDLRAQPLLTFDYAIPADVRIDLFATVDGQRYRVRLTGPAAPIPGVEDLGHLEVQADGRWHAAGLDLLGWLAPYPGARRLDSLEFSADAARDYLTAGIGGNPAQARWWLDQVRFSAPSAASPPALAPGEPQAGETWLGRRLTVAVQAGAAGVDERSLGLRCAGRRFSTADRALSWDAAAGTLSLDLREAGLRLPAAGSVKVSVTAADRTGRSAPPLRFSFRPGNDTTPPGPPRLVGLPSPKVDCDFDTDLGTLRPWGDDAGVALRRTRQARPGEWSLEARSTKLGGLFGIDLGATPFDAAQYPVLDFDYRAPADLRVDLVVTVDGRRRVIKFTDNDETWPILLRLDARADDQWHHATVDLSGLLAKVCGRAAPLVVTELAFGSSGWPGNREGLCWWLDNVRLSAAVHVDPAPDDLALRSQDESGIAGIAWSVDDSPNHEPPAEPTPSGLSQALPKAEGQLVWLHAAAIDGAGNRSPAAAIPLRLAAGPVIPVAAAAPAPTVEDTPTAPVVSYLPARCAERNGFESNTGGWGDFLASQVLRQASGGATGPGCLAVRQTGRDRESGFVVVRDFGETWREFPEVRFRYRAVNAPHAGLQVNGTTFDGARERWTPLVTLRVGGADWQTAVVDVAAQLRQAGTPLDIHRIFLSVALPPDGLLLIDDYAMYSRAAASAGFQWSEPATRTGIAGYSWVLDQASDTMPPEKVLGQARQAEFEDLPPGRHVFHVRARGGSGKWGPASHVPFELTGAAGPP